MALSTGPGKSKILQATPDGCPAGYLIYNFDIGSAVLKKAHREFLTETILHILDTNEEHWVHMIGRASRSGPDRLNDRISKDRVDAVAAFLIKGGISRSRIQSVHLGESEPFSTAYENEEDRSVELHIHIAKTLNLLLENGWRVRPTKVMVDTIRTALGPLAVRAGRELQINVGQGILSWQADLTLDFDPGGRETRPCAGILILGNEGGGEIYVGAHESLRLCNGPQGDPRDPGGIDYASQLQHVFENGEPEFARFVANTCVHELGHDMAQLPHTADPDNFMFASRRLGANLPRERRTIQAMRRHWAGPKSFTPTQQQALVCAMQTGNFPGGMRLGGR
jgi:hypothetical protein